MQPSNPDYNDYEQQGFTQVPGSHPSRPEPPQPYDAVQGDPPVLPQARPGMPPPYAPPASAWTGGNPERFEPEEEQDEYAQEMYQPRQQVPFQNSQVPYQAPRLPHYNRLNMILVLIIGALVIILGGLALSQLTGRDHARTAVVSAGSLGSNHTGDAIVVRNETMYTQSGITQVDYKVDEGTQVQRGTELCTVYTSGFSTREWTTLNNFRTQIKEYQKTLLAETNTEADAQLKMLNSAVLSRAREVQAMIQLQTGILTNEEKLLEKDIEERAYYLKQKYSDDQKLNRLYDDEKAQLLRIETWTKPFAAGDTGIVSFYVDGFERVLNMSTYDSYSPTQVRQIYNGTLPETATLERNEVPIYRIVRQSSYVVLMLCDDTDWTPALGASYELLLESFDDTRVSATVESVTRAEGELLVRLVVYSDIKPVLYVRACHVQLSENIYSLTVPVNALTNDEGQIGVVVVQSDGNYFLPVDVISQDGREAHIVPMLSNILFEGSVVLLF
ncbi:MAG: hypothetical protein J5564_04310 [Clostridia bacterium]|nr:hypothetical protein [Clostridia bacterium]